MIKEMEIISNKEIELIDITDDVKKAVEEVRPEEGYVVIFSQQMRD